MPVADLTYLDALASPSDIEKINAKRAKQGHMIPIPSVPEIWKRFIDLKGWYEPRDQLIRLHYRMYMLENPFASTKGGLEDGGYIMPSGKVQFSRATFPFDVATLAQATMASKHPYVTAMPTSESHTPERLANYEKFVQAVLDNQMLDGKFLKEATGKLMSSGWLIASYPYNPNLRKMGQFPYQMQLLSPLGVYPRFGPGGTISYCFIERTIPGGQLVAEYSMYRGVYELVMNEPDPDDMPDSPFKREWQQPRNNLLNTEFRVVRYWDDQVTCLLIQGIGASSMGNNPNWAFKALMNRNAEGKTPAPVFGNVQSWDDPYYGVAEHHMGRVPMSIVGMWPEIRDATAFETDQYSGRYVYLPFFYSQYYNWRDMSRMLSQYHTLMARATRPLLVTDDKNLKITSDRIISERGAQVAFPQPPPVPPQLEMLFQKMEKMVEQGTIGEAAYGASAGEGGNQQRAITGQGTIRIDAVGSEIENMLAGSCVGMTQTMVKMGSEEFVVAGLGDKYDAPYLSKYNPAKEVKIAPNVKVTLKSRNALNDPVKVMAYKSLDGIIPMSMNLGATLEVPNPEKVIHQMRDESAQTEGRVIEPFIQIAEKKAQLETAKELAQLTMKFDNLQRQLQAKQEMADMQSEMAMLPEEVIIEQGQQTLRQLHDAIAAKYGLPTLAQGEAPIQGGPGMMGQPQPQGGPPQLPPPGGMGPGGPPPDMMGGPPPGPPMPAPAPVIAPAMAGGGLRPYGPPRGFQEPIPMGSPPSGPPPSSPVPPPPSLDNTATGPGQAEQPMQPLERDMPVGGMNRPGVGSGLVGSGPGVTPKAIIQANQQFLPLKNEAGQRPSNRKTRRGTRGRGRR